MTTERSNEEQPAAGNPAAEDAASLPPPPGRVQGGDAATATSPPPPSPPRLGIIHVLLWMLGSAVILFVFRRFNERFLEQPENRHVFEQVLTVPESMAYGAALTGLSLFFFYWRRRSPFPAHPGHWLLLFDGIGILVSWLLFEIQPEEESVIDDYRSFLVRWLIEEASHAGVLGVILVMAGIFLLLRRDVVWSLVMLVLFVVNLEPLILGLIELNVEFRLSGIEWWATISNCARIATFTLPVFAVVAACVVDVCTRTRRDWAHWVGAVCFLSIGVIGCIWEIWGMLVPTVVQ